ncbi:KH domain-containing protein [Eggerthellaceae bacterium zg-1084]|uniref:RNA-binding protein KhpA n=1 Tax=Berryella wangjianweii TaxID=2734634 RepID=A0A6M8J7A5_9ACTN|nr:KH domain-containing protein [Berryella wangjianweii]NPD31252.1 KH domain-containing protein [Berryella wangjianweii]NPD32439.1 KH domain-containing protein [Eggerthellaceae bacterium zg-997]QKF06802.1 KH domain-containing protein [Berryella wangjianweii]
MADNTSHITGLVECIVAPLVDHQDDLEVSATVAEDGTLCVGIRVNDEDTGKVIGRQGRVIKSIRTLARAAASRDDAHVEVEIIE